MSKSENSGLLFKDFPPVKKRDWKKKVIEDLKGADFEKKLVWNTVDDLKIDPFYTGEDLDKIKYLKNYRYRNDTARIDAGQRSSWQNIEIIEVRKEKKGNQLAHEALHMGADGIHFRIPEQVSLKIPELLNDIDPSNNPVWFSVNTQAADLINNYFEYIGTLSDINKNDIQGGLTFDPLRKLSLTGDLIENDFEGLADIIKLSDSIQEFRALTVDTSYLHNCGAGTVQEIAYTLNILVEYIDRLTEIGLPVEMIWHNLSLNLASGTEYFMEIAKFRALRILVYHLVQQYEIKNINPSELFISCQSSLWTKTIYDPYVNMLRNTTEAMAAILGGCDSISVLPFDTLLSNTNDFSRRISRNISNILREESYFDKVNDPAAGSYYIETLTDKLIEYSLELFKETENLGGYVSQFEKGEIQKAIKGNRDKKFELFSRRKKVIVGINQYPNTDEKIDPSDFKTSITPDHEDKVLMETRGSKEFEDLRSLTDRFAHEQGEEKRPKVFLSLIGENKVMRKARASFAWGFFGCAGFKITESNPSASLFKAVEKAIDSKSDIVVICGSDEDYTEHAIEYANAFKSNQNGILVIAGNPLEKKEEMIEAGVEDFIHLRSNIIESLKGFQKKLNIR